MTQKPTNTEDTNKKPAEKTAAESPVIDNTIIKITIPWEKAEPAYHSARQSFAQTVKAPGFRKGKVPPDVAEKLMGTAKIIEKALEKVLPDIYMEKVKEEKRLPLTHPELRGVKLDIGSDWIVEAEIAERPEIKLGDYKKVVTEAKKHVRKELEEQEKKNLAENKEAKPFTDVQKKEATLEHIYQDLVGTIKPKIQDLLVRREVEYDIQQLGRQLQAMNFTFQEYLERRKMTETELTQQMAASALGRLQIIFVLDEIAKENKLDVTDKEIDAYIEEKVEAIIRTQYAKNMEYRQMVGQTLLRQKVSDFLLAL